MIWGAMSTIGTAGLYSPPPPPPGTTMNGKKYVNLLEEKLELHMQVHQCTIFMLDGAPCHRSKLASAFLKSKGVKTLDWPGNSPDLNPIDNLWEILKQKVADKQPSSGKALVDTIKNVWVTELSGEYCRNLSTSMPRRVHAVIESRGGPTR